MSEKVITVQVAINTLDPVNVSLDRISDALRPMVEAQVKKAKEPELFHGYTMEQWQRIIDECHPDGTKKYLCEFGRNGGDIRGTVLSTLEEIHPEWLDDEPFVISNDTDIAENCFKSCRPAQRYGVLIPHFGGGKPEWLKDDDRLVWWKGGNTVGGTASLRQDTWSSHDWKLITEFIAMPGAPK